MQTSNRVRGISVENPLLQINHLSTSFRIGDQYYRAVDDVSLSVNRNEVLGIVGESGSGKSALAFSIMRLHNRAKIEGKINLEDTDLVKASTNELNKLRGDSLSMIFQDPLTALNPLMEIGAQIGET